MNGEAEAALARDGARELFTEASAVARPVFERCGFQVIGGGPEVLAARIAREYSVPVILLSDQSLATRIFPDRRDDRGIRIGDTIQRCRW